ncbi:hypothetical protein ACVCL0_10795 [Rhodanobacter sp. UC4450_H17]
MQGITLGAYNTLPSAGSPASHRAVDKHNRDLHVAAASSDP